ncbi:MAG: NAD(+)/NADH kinase [Planctomycetes bacterium]|nr:NAD(+)/NADH kinase [Planctomycetota bacterium]
MARVLIVGDERKGRVRTLVADVAAHLRAQGHAVEVDVDRGTSLENRAADLVAVFGGDGSILATGRRLGGNQLPTLGINLGRLGFLTAYGDDRAVEGIEAALRGELVEEPRMMLRCRVERRDGSVAADALCLNDVVLSRDARAGMITVVASRHEWQLAAYAGDGLIIATPVGSTAYALAVGGPVLSPRLDAIVLAPLAPHTLTLRPLVLPAGPGVRLRVLETGGPPTCMLAIDGQVYVPVSVEDRVTIEPAEVRFRHLTRGPGSFFSILRDKFGWADLPRGLAEEQ